MTSGIYVIINILNNKKYIGSSIDVNRRIYDHRSKLINNNHRNTYLQSSWNKYGEDIFVFSIIDVVPEELLQEREEYWCKKLDTHNSNNGYNLAPITRNGPCSEEYRKTCSDNCDTKKIIYMVDINGNIVNEFESVKEASVKLDLDVEYTRRLIKGYRAMYKRKHMLFDKKDFTKEELQERINKTFKKKIYQFTLKREFIAEYLSVSEAARVTGIKSIPDCFRKINKQKSAGGYLWSYTERCPEYNNTKYKIQMLDKDLNILEEFNTVKEAAELLNIKTKGIHKAISGERKSYNGFIWKKNKL